ncbi:MAG: alpha/beta hydrolase [Candidatus Angelobacter sp.]
MPVFFATDRAISKETAEHCSFANRRSNDRELKYGTCQISIPKGHKVGELEAPNWFKLEFFKDPEKHVVLLSTQVLQKKEFFSSVKKSVAASPAKNAFVFIHGYNVGFDDAARRTAQIAYDLQFQGAPILYSWPSRANLLRYAADEATIDVSAQHFLRFLTEVATKSGARILHVIAHSMGNRALLTALEKLSVNPNRPAIHNVILTAPDIDAQRFYQIAASINKYPSRITLYSSSNDRAILLSKQFHSYVRAGDAGKNIVVARGVDTVDASVVDTSMFGLGHSYFARKRTVLSDIFQLIAKNRPPKKRFGLKEKKHQNGVYWEFVR